MVIPKKHGAFCVQRVSVRQMFGLKERIQLASHREAHGTSTEWIALDQLHLRDIARHCETLRDGQPGTGTMDSSTPLQPGDRIAKCCAQETGRATHVRNIWKQTQIESN
eukprot:s3963_g8.t1